MARLATGAAPRYSGLYDYVRMKTEEEAARRTEYSRTGVSGGDGWFRCPHHRRLGVP